MQLNWGAHHHGLLTYSRRLSELFTYYKPQAAWNLGRVVVYAGYRKGLSLSHRLCSEEQTGPDEPPIHI
jgi:hypothetical protein